MSETEESKEVSKETESKEEQKHIFDLNTREGRRTMFDVLLMVKGIDPDQVQGMAKFMNPDSVDETTYYPTQLTSIAIAQSRIFGRAFYPNDSWNEYEEIADLIGTGFKGYKGWKSDQYKDITSGQPDLSKLQGVPEETKQGLLSGFFSRGK